MNETDGRTSETPFARFDPDTCSLRTSQVTLDLGLDEPSVTLPRSGSMRSGRLFERPTLAPATHGTAGSFWRGLPTPTARDWKGAAKNPEARGRVMGSLDEAVEVLLPRQYRQTG